MIPDACLPSENPPEVIQPAPEPTIADLLAKSRAAHLQKKHHAGKADKGGTVTSQPDYLKAEQAIRDAIRYRKEAHAIDPDQQDPAWLQDQALNKGVSSQSLLNWFEAYLNLP